MIERVILWLALAGMVLAVHLWIQKARGFDQGCLGVLKPIVLEEAGGCEEVGALPASHLFGISNAAWGYAFYFGLALVSLGKLVVGARVARALHRVSEAATALALVYSGYLVFQMAFVAHAWCVLCTVSAGLVATLAAAHAAMRWRGGFRPVAAEQRALELGWAGGALFAGVGLLLGVVLFVNRLGTRPLTQGQTGAELEQLVEGRLAAIIDPQKFAEIRACRFEPGAKPIDLGAFVDAEAPFTGRADGVPAVVFMDPNCGHCRNYFPVWRELAERADGHGRFIVAPLRLWPESTDQIAALKLAEKTGKYFELWQRMFDAQKPGRRFLSLKEIADLWREVGLEATGLEQRIAELRPVIETQSAEARKLGIRAAPTVFVGGRKVWMRNRSADCLGKLIDRAQVNARELVR
jgi:uncharacterized membrane protein/protein-disulfide isomerase